MLLSHPKTLQPHMHQMPPPPMFLCTGLLVPLPRYLCFCPPAMDLFT